MMRGRTSRRGTWALSADRAIAKSLPLRRPLILHDEQAAENGAVAPIDAHRRGTVMATAQPIPTVEEVEMVEDRADPGGV